MDIKYAYIRQTKEKRFRYYVRMPDTKAVFADGDYSTRKEARARLLEAHPDAEITTRRYFIHGVQ